MLKSKWTWTAIVLLVILAVGVLSVQWIMGQYLSAEGMSDRLSDALDREVQIESVQFSIWSGIQLRAIEVSEYPGFDRGTALKARSLSLKPAWWPLLFGDVRISRASVDGADVTLHRGSDGSWNVLDEPDAGKDGETSSSDGPGETSNSDGGSQSMSLAIDQVHFTDGTIRYRDDAIDFNQEYSFRYIVLRDFSLGQGGTLEMDGVEIPGGTLTGQVALKRSPLAVSVNQLNLNLNDRASINKLTQSLSEQSPSLEDGTATLNVTDGRLTSDSVAVSFRGEATDQEFSLASGPSLGWNTLQFTGDLLAVPGNFRVVINIDEASVKQGRSGPDGETKFNGNLQAGKLRWSTDGPNGTLQAEGTLRETTVSDPRLPEPVTLASATLTSTGNAIDLSNIQGELGGATFGGSISAPLFSDGNQPMKATLRTDSINASTVKKLVPAQYWPAGYGIDGSIAVPGLNVTGPLGQPSFDGKINVKRLSVSTPYLRRPLDMTQQTLGLRGQQLRIDNWTARLGDESISANGHIDLMPSLKGQLSLQTKGYPLKTLWLDLSQQPDIPSSWRPEGNLDGTTEISFQPDRLSASGRITVPSLSVGMVDGSDVNARVSFEKDQLRINQFTMNGYGGQLEGNGTVKSLFDSPRLESNLSLNNVQVESLLTNLAGVGKGSAGSIGTDVSLKGSLNSLQQLSGKIKTWGSDINLKHVPAINNTGDAIVRGISNSLGGDLGPIISQVMNRNLSEQKRELQRVFSNDVTANYDKLRGSVSIENGKGTIETGVLSNRYLSVNTDGNVWLNGKLQTDVLLQPKQPLIEKANQDWMVSLLKSGLPPLKVKGSLTNPTYDMEAFQKQVVKTITRSALMDNNGQKKSSPEDRLKKKLLNELLK